MRPAEIVQNLTQGDQIVDGAGKVGKALTALGIFGTITTANLQYYALIVAGGVTLGMQMWWEWYRQKRRAQIEAEYDRKRAWRADEIEKARLLKQLADEGIDTATLRALQQSPDPDSEVTP